MSETSTYQPENGDAFQKGLKTSFSLRDDLADSHLTEDEVVNFNEKMSNDIDKIHEMTTNEILQVKKEVFNNQLEKGITVIGISESVDFVEQLSLNLNMSIQEVSKIIDYMETNYDSNLIDNGYTVKKKGDEIIVYNEDGGDVGAFNIKSGEFHEGGIWYKNDDLSDNLSLGEVNEFTAETIDDIITSAERYFDGNGKIENLFKNKDISVDLGNTKVLDFISAVTGTDKERLKDLNQLLLGDSRVDKDSGVTFRYQSEKKFLLIGETTDHYKKDHGYTKIAIAENDWLDKIVGFK